MNNLPCPPAHWPRFSALLDAALDMPEASRTSWLNALAGEDATVRPWLERVLGGAASLRTGDFLRPPLVDAANARFAPGAMVGPYRLRARLGEGGMGEVWLAARCDDGPQRDVALKLPHAEFLGGPFRARFARERDLLASLAHPHIATLYDAGSSAENHPYLALEWVHGRPITTACSTTGASLERRIDLVMQVLEGLAYAHQRLIVHRDIKPSNVLVTPEGTAKLLDFGIAKMLSAEPQAQAELTQPQAQMATAAYAAPEQFSGGAITVATDLFSAGVLLFELCTGHRPFARVPHKTDAPPASLASQRADAACSGAPEGKKLAARLRGDLDAVIAKAVALEPAARYTSAEAFAADLRRWRAGLPVRARRIGWANRAEKFIRRNKLGVALAAVLVLALAGGTTGIAWQAHRAERQAARANAIKDYLVKLFDEGNPASGRSIITMTAKELLDIGADRADAAFAHDPTTEMELLETFGGIYTVLSEAARAEAMYAHRLDLARRVYGPLDPHVIQASLDLVEDEDVFQDEDKARPLLEQIRDPVYRLYGGQSLQWAQWLQARAQSLRDVHGGRAEAIADDTAAIAIYARYFPNDVNYPDALEDLSGYQYDGEDCAGALASAEKARAVLLAQNRLDPLEEMQNRANIATMQSCLGNVAEADAVLALVQAQAERQLGRQSIWYIHAVTSRALNADTAGDRVRANTMLESLMAQKMDGAASTGLPNSARRAYGSVLARDGRAAEGIPYLEAALAETRRHVRDEPNLRRTEAMLGDAYDQAGRTEEARALLKAARDDYLRYSAPGMPMILGAQERWGRFLLDHGDSVAAASEFNNVLAGAHGVPSAQAAMAATGLARIALAAGEMAKADALTAQAEKWLAATTHLYDVRMRVDVWLVRAKALLATSHAAEARALATRAAKAAAAYDAPDSPQLLRAENFVRSLDTAGAP